MRDEFEHIAHSIDARIGEQRAYIQELTNAHRSTRDARRQLTALTEARERIESLRSRFS